MSIVYDGRKIQETSGRKKISDVNNKLPNPILTSIAVQLKHKSWLRVPPSAKLLLLHIAVRHCLLHETSDVKYC